MKISARGLPLNAEAAGLIQKNYEQKIFSFYSLYTNADFMDSVILPIHCSCKGTAIISIAFLRIDQLFFSIWLFVVFICQNIKVQGTVAIIPSRYFNSWDAFLYG
jgi:hypothetical protein